MRDFFGGFTHCPERTAFRIDGVDLTYAELDRESKSYAAGLTALGICPGDRVALQAHSSRALLVALVGHLRSGIIHVPINTRYKADEVAHILTDSGASLVLADHGMPAGAIATDLGLRSYPLPALPRSDTEPPELPSGDAVAMLIYTSGTTGQSKGVVLTHDALTANIGSTTSLWQWSPSDHLVLTLPLFHVHGLGLGVLGTLFHQMTATIHPRFDAEQVVRSIGLGGTIFMGVPTMYARLISHLETQQSSREILAKARLYTSGSAALPASAHHAFETLTGHRILERYGMSETGFTLSNPYDKPRKPGSVGHPVPGYEVRVVNEAGETCKVGESGEIWVRGTGLMQAYWQQPEITQAAFTDGWFRTGDIAFVDDQGYHHIQGRASADIIKSGGFKISALEIEDVLLRHSGIVEAAVIGLPCPEWGERIVAAIVLTPDTEYDHAAFTEFTKERLANYKCPRDFFPVNTLPRNALGKLQKHRLKSTLTDRN